MFLYYYTNYLLVLVMLVLLYMPNSLEVVVAANTVAVDTAAFSGILLT